MTIFTVFHTTTYRYRRPVTFGQHRMMFRPRDSYDQRLLDSTLLIKPKPASLRWLHDAFGNCVTLVKFNRKSAALRFESKIQLEHSPLMTPDFQTEEYAKIYPFSYDLDEQPDLAPFIVRRYPDPTGEVDRWAQKFIRAGRGTPTGKLLMTLTCAIRESFTYDRRSESGTQDPVTTLRLGRGTCRDFALFMIEAVRSLGLAARFVSGYLYVPERDRTEYEGGGATHAWCQVYLPGGGWIEFDPTNGIIGNRDLIRVVVARDPRQAIPLIGTFSGTPADELGMTVEVIVKASVAAEKVNASSL
jgi:transglutaminase-like putative cysteine protease